MTENPADPGREFPFLKCLYYLRTATQWRTMQLSSTKFQRNAKEKAANIDAGVADDGSTRNSGNGGCGEAGPDSSAKTHRQRLERPVGAKRAIEAQQTTMALERGARGIETLATAAKKRAKLSEQVYHLEKMKSQMNLFSMEGTPKSVRSKFLEVMQKRALAELYSTTSDTTPESKNSSEQHSLHSNHPRP
jgi:hypothetical protein